MMRIAGEIRQNANTPGAILPGCPVNRWGILVRETRVEFPEFITGTARARSRLKLGTKLLGVSGVNLTCSISGRMGPSPAWTSTVSLSTPWRWSYITNCAWVTSQAPMSK
jgi:hypothetical protein